MNFIFAVVAAVVLSQTVWAQVLSQRSIYERCYMKLVRQAAQADDPYLAQIAAGTLTGAEACVSLLDLAQFNAGNGQIPAYASQPAKRELAMRVLASMHDFHDSWFTIKEFNSGSNDCFDQVTNGVIDSQVPALFLTRALFNPNKTAFNFASIVTATDVPRALRTVDDPDRSIFGPDKLSTAPAPDFSSFPNSFRFAGNGPLMGVGTWEALPIATLNTVARVTGDNPILTNNNVRKSQGGGILGSQAYLLNNFGENAMVLPDLEKLPRHFSKYVYTDLFCRELPVLAAGDADSFVVPASTLPFRKDKSCVQCHASMDQLVGVVRNQRLFKSGTCSAQNRIYNLFSLSAQAQTTLDTSWPANPSATYRQKQPFGRLFYRDYNNTLRNIPVNGLAELGAAIANSNDLYVCAAKRYYRYFTGIDVDLTPVDLATLSADQKFYRNRVIGLGLKLKGTTATDFNRDPLKLIEAIFALPEYQSRDFFLKCKSQGAACP